ncbi:chromate transporter [Borrelia sp. P9F1]|uniref:chromate transporter n=1 Tax=Borrelia sp. P9F1 TaxID=3058374 RepID=UPI002646FC52|nr:chromate transporter [Borrelia sp. P9F1]WKC58007.1 chromate transporter [Borrelia sp. P9F1]
MKEPREGSYGLFKLFYLVLKITTLTIGGGLLIISELRKKIVNNKKLISEKDFNEILATSNVVPGVTAINFAFLIGKKLKGFRGAILLTIAGILPSIVVITVLAIYVTLDSNNIYLEKFLEGAKISSTILMSIVILEFSKQMLRKSIIKWVTCLGVTYIIYGLRIDITYILLVFLLVCFTTHTIKKRFFQNKAQI